MNTMKELKETVATRMHNTLDGREIDMIKQMRPELPHMLGITEIGEVHDHGNEDGTLLDPNHEFWDEYEDDVQTKRAVARKIETAIKLLRDEGRVRMEYPYGEEAEVIYVEVDKPQLTTMKTPCRNCGTPLSAEPILTLDTDSYYISLSLDCDECEFTGTFRTELSQL